MLISKGKIVSLLLVFAVGISCSLYLFYAVKSWETKREIATFRELSGDLKDSLQREVDREIEILYSVRSFYNGSNFVDPDEFKIFTANALQRHPEIQSIEWIPRVKASELEKYKKEYWPNLEGPSDIFVLSPQEQLIPAPLKKEYFPLTYSEPFERNKSALRIDYSSRLIRFKAMNEASDNDKAVVSTKVELYRINDPNKDAIFIFLPVYLKNNNLMSVEERKENLQGFIAILLKMDLLANDVFKDYLSKFQIKLFSDPQKKAEDLLYNSDPSFLSKEDIVENSETLFVANKTWTLSTIAKRKNIFIYTWQAYSVLLVGLSTTLLITFYLYFLLTQNTRIQKEVERQTKYLEEEIAYQKKIKQELQSAREELLRSNKELEQFAYVASHDLQEPLRKILAFGESLGKKITEKITEEENDYLKRMLSASQRMKTLIEDLLQYSRVNVQKHAFEKVDLNEILKEALSSLELRIEQTHSQVYAEPLPVIQANPILMKQLFQNLIGNALKFHKAGQGTQVEIKSKTDMNNVHIEVRDNGIGIEMQYSEKIFQPFQRLHSRSEYEGTGIGLAICQKIVEKHKGKINVVSEEGKGTTFSIDLPI